MVEQGWQKSSFSSGDVNQNCLEVALPADARPRLRESTDPGIVLVTTRSRLEALLRRLRSETGDGA